MIPKIIRNLREKRLKAQKPFEAPKSYFHPDEEKKRTPMATDQEKKDALDTMVKAYDPFYRKNTPATSKAFQDAVTACRKAGISDPQMSIETRKVHVSVARENLVDAVKAFRKNPEGDEELDALRSAKAAYASLGGAEDEIKKIVKDGMK